MADTAADEFQTIWELYLKPVKEKIRQRAQAIAESDERKEIAAVDAIDALKEYIPGKPVVPSVTPPSQGWFNRNVTGFMFITAAMAVIFGVLGLWPQTNGQNFIEIAKIFAGALVGSAAGAAAISIKK